MNAIARALWGTSAARCVAWALAGALAGGTALHQVHRAAAERAALQQAQAALQHQRETLRAIEAAQSETARLQEVADEAHRQATQRIQTNARAAAAARTELERLRHAIATGPGPGCAPAGQAGAERADPARELLGQCAAQLVELGRAADAHAADALRLYEAWPRNEATEAAAP